MIVGDRSRSLGSLENCSAIVAIIWKPNFYFASDRQRSQRLPTIATITIAGIDLESISAILAIVNDRQRSQRFNGNHLCSDSAIATIAAIKDISQSATFTLHLCIFFDTKMADEVEMHSEEKVEEERDAANYSVEGFMEEVQKYPCLYDKFSKEFKDKFKKVNSWKKIGQKFDMSAEEAEKRFNNARTSYGRYLKKQKKSGSGRQDARIPREFKNLEWLAVYIDHRPTSSNLKKKGEKTPETMIQTENSIEFEAITDDEAEVESSSFDADADDIMVENWGGDSDDHLLRETSDNDSTENSPSGSVSEKGKNGSIASGSSSKTLSAKSKGKAIKSRPWGAAESKPKHAVDRALIKTANSLAEQVKAGLVKKSEEVKRKLPEDFDDEDSLFCRSIVPRIKRLPVNVKGYVRLQIEKLLFEVELSHPQTQAGNNVGRHNFHNSTFQQPTISQPADQQFSQSTNYSRSIAACQETRHAVRPPQPNHHRTVIHHQTHPQPALPTPVHQQPVAQQPVAPQHVQQIHNQFNEVDSKETFITAIQGQHTQNSNENKQVTFCSFFLSKNVC